jgi:hypothetical protein
MTRLQYVQNPKVQEILQLSLEQRGAIAKMRFAVVVEKGVPVKGTQEQLDELLDPAQKKTLRQLELQAVQRYGLQEVLLRRDVADELKLTTEQRRAIDRSWLYHQSDQKGGPGPRKGHSTEQIIAKL